jgi:hypothetical protein
MKTGETASYTGRDGRQAAAGVTGVTGVTGVACLYSREATESEKRV